MAETLGSEEKGTAQSHFNPEKALCRASLHCVCVSDLCMMTTAIATRFHKAKKPRKPHGTLYIS